MPIFSNFHFKSPFLEFMGCCNFIVGGGGGLSTPEFEQVLGQVPLVISIKAKQIFDILETIKVQKTSPSHSNLFARNTNKNTI